jgi:hypothetical protein
MALYKRGNTWWMNFWFNSEHVQKSTRCRNKRDAEAIERAYYTQLTKGEVGSNQRRPFLNFGKRLRVSWRGRRVSTLLNQTPF